MYMKTANNIHSSRTAVNVNVFHNVVATSKLFQIRYHEYLVKQDKVTYFNLPAKKISQI